MQHEGLLAGAFQAVDELFVLGGAKVQTTSAWVSPRVNSAEPWVRGRMPTSATIGRTVVRSRPSTRFLVSSTALRITSASTS